MYSFFKNSFFMMRRYCADNTNTLRAYSTDPVDAIMKQIAEKGVGK